MSKRVIGAAIGAVGLIVSSTANAALLAEYLFTSGSLAPSNVLAGLTANNASASGLTNVAGTTVASQAFPANTFAATYRDVTTSDYIQFSFNPTTGSGNTIDLTSVTLSANLVNSSRAGVTFSLQYSTNGTTFSNTGITYGTGSNAIDGNPTSFTINIGSTANLIGLSNTTYFRLFFNDTDNTNGDQQNRGLYVDDFRINGSVNAAPVPVPAAAWLLGTALVGMAGIGRRKQV